MQVEQDQDHKDPAVLLNEHRSSLSLITAVILGGVFVLLIVMNILLANKVETERQAWTDYAQDVAKVSQRTGQLKSEIGYGGFIHNYKNFILSGDEQFAIASQHDLENAREILDELIRHPFSTGAPELLVDVAKTLAAYSTAIESAIEQIDRLDRSDLEALVRVDDDAAFLALDEYEMLLISRLEERLGASRAEARNVELFLNISNAASAAVILAAGLIIYLARQSARLNSLKLAAFQQANALIDESPDGILMVNKDGEIVRANSSASKLFGYSQYDLTTMTIEQLVPTRVRSYHAKYRGMYERTGGSRSMGSGLDLTGLRRDGEEFPIDVSLSKVMDTHGRQLTVASVRDVTHLAEAAKQLELLTREANRANEAKGQFLATMSHELRTPLNAISGFSEMIKTEALGGIDNKSYVEYADHIFSSGQHLLGIVNDVLDLSRVEAGQFEFYPESFDVLPIINDAVMLVSTGYNRRPENTNVDIDDNAAVLTTDLKSFRQTLINILTNAAKFTPETKKVWVSVQRIDEVTTEVMIRDEGVGIPAGEIDNVLEPFGQARGNAHIAHEGTGLGLSLSKSLMELQGGSLSISSEVEVGTVVTLRFIGQV